MDYPMPNDKLGEQTVIASVWYKEDIDEQIVLVLLMNKESPFFETAFVHLDTEMIEHIGTHYNIVPAVREYEDNGGDY